MAILIGIAVPAIFNFVRSPLVRASNQLIVVIKELKFESILTNRHLALEIDPEKSAYEILSQDLEKDAWVQDSGFEQPITLADEVQIAVVEKGLKRFEREKVRLYFEPTGLVDPFYVVFYLDDEKITLKIENVFGNATVSPIEDFDEFKL